MIAMSRSWLVNSRAIAKKVKNASRSPALQIKDCGANRECPNCHCCIDNSDVSQEWPGLPAGIKFDPSDVELLEHLEAKCGVGDSKPHMLIDEFIPTLEGDQGICYCHPENLPGAKKDGSSIHFFHRTTNAYSTGQRKRRKIQHNLNEEQVRWHKTGKTKPVIKDGIQKGCRKIMVLYRSSKKLLKPDKSNWVMHQYHLGTDEDEKHGEYVVSRIFYQQPKQTERNDECAMNEDQTGNLMTSEDPRTPKTNPPNPPRPGKSMVYDDVAKDHVLEPIPQVPLDIDDSFYNSLPAVHLEDISWLAGESQAIDNPDLDSVEETLLCKEEINSSALGNNANINNSVSDTNTANNTISNFGPPCGIADLENLDFDTPPDFHLSDLQFGSQESILEWLDRF